MKLSQGLENTHNNTDKQRARNSLKYKLTIERCQLCYLSRTVTYCDM
jgi:hypothetical protein